MLMRGGGRRGAVIESVLVHLAERNLGGTGGVEALASLNFPCRSPRGEPGKDENGVSKGATNIESL